MCYLGDSTRLQMNMVIILTKSFVAEFTFLIFKKGEWPLRRIILRLATDVLLQIEKMRGFIVVATLQFV